MGQRDEYLASNDEWHESLTLAQRVERWPVQSSYGTGIEHLAATAVDRARQQAIIANAAYTIVKEQAVYALLRQNQTVRAIAAATGIPKSEVGRIARTLGGQPGRPDSYGHAVSPDQRVAQATTALIRDAWGNPDAR